MKKILIIIAVFCSLSARSQTPCDNMLFPTIDSLRSYINIYIRNSAVTAFTNLRLNTSLVGVTQWLDCIDATGGSSGNTNTGSGYRLLIQLTQELKTLVPGFGVAIDSALSGRLRITADTAVFSKTVIIDSTGIGLRYAAPAIAGQDDTLVIYSSGGIGDSVMDYINIQKSGADNTGVADVSAHITAAAATGLPVYFPKGTYLISSTVTLPDNTKLIGDGAASIIKLTTNITAFEAGDYTQFESLAFLGNSASTSQRGINIDSVRGVKIMNCNFKSIGVGVRMTKTGLISGDGFTFGTQLIGLYGEDCDRGIWSDTRGEYATISNCSFNSGNYGVYMSGGNNSIIGGNYNTNNYGLYLTDGSNDAHCTAVGVKFNHNNIASVYVTGVLNGYRFIGCMLYGGDITVLNSTDISFTDCNINVTGFEVTSTSNTGFKFFNNNFYGTTTWTITGTKPTVMGMSNVGGLTLYDPVANITYEMDNAAGLITHGGSYLAGARAGVDRHYFYQTIQGETGTGSETLRDINLGSMRVDVPGGSTIGDPIQFYNPNNTTARSIVAMLDKDANYAFRAIAANGHIGLRVESPAISLISGYTDAWGFPKGTTAQRPTGVSGYVRVNSDSTNAVEYYDGSAWQVIASRNWTRDNAGAADAWFATYTLAADKTFAGSGSAEVITFDTEEAENAISHSTVTNPEEITLTNAGVYTISIDFSVSSTTAADAIKSSIQVWDGDSWEFVANTGALFKITGASETTMYSKSYQQYWSAGTKIRVVMSASSTDCFLNFIASGADAAAVPAARIVISGRKAPAP